MKGIVLSDDQLKMLEKRFGPAVWMMGPWNSDGTFGYSWIAFPVVESAAQSTADPALMMALSRLNDASEPSAPFIALLETFGNSLIERIVDAYRQRSVEPASGTLLPPAPQAQEPERTAAATE